MRIHGSCAPVANAVLLSGVGFLLLALSPAVASDTAGDFAKAAPERLAAYLRVDTVNPPGNESRGVAFLASILAEAGIEFESAESAPGRGNLWARLAGGPKPGLVLLHHIDVVPADAKYWDGDPLAGSIDAGYVTGRGALDMKGLGIVQLQAFLSLAASQQTLDRDVWFVATADEEAGGLFGAGWLVENRPEIFEKVGFLLNEGGLGTTQAGKVQFDTEVTQKVPLWLRLTARGRPGHGSAPQVETAVTRLLRAGQRIAETQFPARAIPSVARYFAALAENQTGEFQRKFASIGDYVDDADFLLLLQLESPWQHALLRNTCSLTRLEGSAKINVVPAEASLELDCRLLPDQDPIAFRAELETIVNDPQITIEEILSFSPAVSGTDNELYQLIGEVTASHIPGSTLIPRVGVGFTDSHFFRDMGIVAYGFAPFVLPVQDLRGVHGNNERISVENLERGTRIMSDLITRFAAK